VPYFSQGVLTGNDIACRTRGSCSTSRWGAFEGQATDIDIHATEIRQVRRQLDGILARHTAQSLQRIRKDPERDYFMDPSDAMEYGLIDDILQRRENLPNN